MLEQIDVLDERKVPTVERELSRLKDMSLPEVTRIGDEAKRGMASNFITFSASVKIRVEKFGIDMRSSMPPILYQLAMGVAEGRLVHGLVNVWLGNERLGEAVVNAEPPMIQQQKLLDSPTVKIYELPPIPTAEPPVRDVPIIELKKDDIETLIDTTAGQVRETEAEQLQYLSIKRHMGHRAVVHQAKTSGTFTCDRRKKIVYYKCSLGIVAIPFRDIEIMNEYREGKI